jgi:hypothetical protein
MAASWPWRPCREEFGLAERIQRQPALDPRTHRGKGYTPLVYVTQLLHCFTSGGVSLADAERLNQDVPFKAFLVVEKLPDPTSIGEWLRDMGEPGWQALRRDPPPLCAMGPWPGPSRAATNTWAARNVSSMIRRSKSAGARWKGLGSITKAGGRWPGNG